MKHFATSIRIAAPAATVWAVLTDSDGWMRWNPTISGFKGRIGPGETVTVYAKVANGRGFPVKVAVFDPPRRMIWRSGMPLGLFKGERTFTITPVAGGVDFAMDERFSGPLSGMITKSIPDLQPDFDAFARALKAEAEARG